MSEGVLGGVLGCFKVSGWVKAMGRSSGGCCFGTTVSPVSPTVQDGILGDMWDMGTHGGHGGLYEGTMGVSMGESFWRGLPGDLCGVSMGSMCLSLCYLSCLQCGSTYPKHSSSSPQYILIFPSHLKCSQSCPKHDPKHTRSQHAASHSQFIPV